MSAATAVVDFNKAMKNYYNNQTNQPTYINTPQPIYPGVNTQQPIPFPGKWNEPPEPAIISPYVDWDKNVWVVTRVDSEGNGHVWSVFSNEKEADSFAERFPPQEYEYYDISPYKLDEEVPIDEPKGED